MGGCGGSGTGGCGGSGVIGSGPGGMGSGPGVGGIGCGSGVGGVVMVNLLALSRPPDQAATSSTVLTQPSSRRSNVSYAATASVGRSCWVMNAVGSNRPVPTMPISLGR